MERASSLPIQNLPPATNGHSMFIAHLPLLHIVWPKSFIVQRHVRYMIWKQWSKRFHHLPGLYGRDLVPVNRGGSTFTMTAATDRLNNLRASYLLRIQTTTRRLSIIQQSSFPSLASKAPWNQEDLPAWEPDQQDLHSRNTIPAADTGLK